MNDKQRETSGSSWGLKHYSLLVLAVFAVALGIVVGRKMSAEAIAVVIGVVCGVSASVPTTALVVVALLRRERRRDEELGQQQGRPGAFPPVVVIQGGSPQALPYGAQGGYWPAPAPGPAASRQFHVVGGAELLGE